MKINRLVKIILSLLLVSLLRTPAFSHNKKIAEDMKALESALQDSHIKINKQVAKVHKNLQKNSMNRALFNTSIDQYPLDLKKWPHIKQKNILFEKNQFSLNKQAKAVLKHHAAFLHKHAELSVVLIGHADEEDSQEKSIKLAHHRADKIAEFLATNGVSKTQIQLVSFGKSLPRVKGQTELTNVINRRVEIVYT